MANEARRARVLGLILCGLLPGACTNLAEVGKVPAFTPIDDTLEHQSMFSDDFPNAHQGGATGAASLWNGGRESLLGDRRAGQPGDILTVVIEIDEQAEISNSTSRSRSGSDSLSVPSLLGIPQAIDGLLPNGASLSEAARTQSSSRSAGDGSVRRNEQLTLRVAATVVEVLANGVLRIQGSQEVRVNFEIRELLVTGYVRPTDISRQNEITYDRIASARISYGGRGQITAVQQPRYGQQIVDGILPF